MIAWLAGRGHAVRLLLVRPRLPAAFVAAATLPPGVRLAGRGILPLPGGLFAPAMLARRTLAGVPGVRAALRRRAYGGADAVLGAPVPPAAADWCARQIAALRPDAVIADTLFRAPVLARVPPGIRRVVLTHDVFHRRHAALRGQGYRVYPEELTAETEAAMLGPADLVVAIQPDEAAAFAALLPGRMVVTAPMPAAPVPRPAGAEREPGRLVFLGSDTLPNRDGLAWFLADIWPLLRRARPDLALDVIGSVGAAMAAPAGVRVHGRVPALAPTLHRASLAIAPLRAGSGLKVKLLDYLAHGLGVVTTPAGAEGFAPGAPFVIADGAERFAASVLAALAEPAAAREAAALDYVSRFHGAGACFAGLGAALGV